MKKVVFFVVGVFALQISCMNMFGQNKSGSVEDQFDIISPNITLRLSSRWPRWHWDNPVEYFAGMATVGEKGLGFGINQKYQCILV
jgi:hypothetical protein